MFVFFHVCDHSLNYKNRTMEEQRFLLEGPIQYIRRITKGAIITDIIGVIVHEQLEFNRIIPIDYDAREKFDTTTKHKGYYDEDDETLIDYSPWIESGEYIPREYYEKYLHNRIKWNVRPPTKYTVVVNMIIQGDFKTRVDADMCERCQGNGWYVDLTNNNNEFNRSTGAYKVLQNVIKDLITKIGSSRSIKEYGQRLHLLPREHYDEERLFEDVQLEVEEVEMNYIVRQQEIINELPGEEILIDLEVIKVSSDPENKTKVMLMLRIVTQEEDRLFQFKF